MVCAMVGVRGTDGDTARIQDSPFLMKHFSRSTSMISEPLLHEALVDILDRPMPQQVGPHDAHDRRSDAAAVVALAH